MASKAVLRAAVSICLVAAIGVSGCGGSSKKKKTPPDPVTMALTAPGVRTVVIPKQSRALTVIVPPCGLAKTKQETTRTPPGSNRIVVPRSALDQTVAIQPCMQGAKSARSASTVLLSPGGTGSPASQKTKPPNQLILPRNSNVTRLIVPPCLIMMSSASSGGQTGGPNTVLPGARNRSAVTAPPCTVHMTSSASS